MKIRLHTFAAAAGLILTARFAAASNLPDPNLTPGVARPDVTAADLCPIAHTPGLRNVPQSEKMAVYRAYGILPHQGYCAVEQGCEVDHLISLEIGGANDQANLWPQPYSGTVWNAHVKDKLENRLHALVCAGTISLEEAQHAIATDWIAAYKHYIGSEPQPIQASAP
jgi:hypothetical protein